MIKHQSKIATKIVARQNELGKHTYRINCVRARIYRYFAQSRC